MIGQLIFMSDIVAGIFLYLGKMVVTANQQGIVVTLIGYLEGPGAGASMDITVESDGQFRLDIPAPSDDEPFRLFKEAPCRYTIQQLTGVSTFFEIDPKVSVLLLSTRTQTLLP